MPRIVLVRSTLETSAADALQTEQEQLARCSYYQRGFKSVKLTTTSSVCNRGSIRNARLSSTALPPCLFRDNFVIYGDPCPPLHTYQLRILSWGHINLP